MSELDGYAEFVRERGKLMDEIERLRGLLREARILTTDGTGLACRIDAHLARKDA